MQPTRKHDFTVNRFEETTDPLPCDLLREIPKPDEETHITFKILTKDLKPVGFWLHVKGTW